MEGDFPSLAALLPEFLSLRDALISKKAKYSSKAANSYYLEIREACDAMLGYLDDAEGEALEKRGVLLATSKPSSASALLCRNIHFSTVFDPKHRLRWLEHHHPVAAERASRLLDVEYARVKADVDAKAAAASDKLMIFEPRSSTSSLWAGATAQEELDRYKLSFTAVRAPVPDPRHHRAWLPRAHGILGVSDAKQAAPDDCGSLKAETMERRLQQWLKHGFRGGKDWERAFKVLTQSEAKFAAGKLPLA